MKQESQELSRWLVVIPARLKSTRLPHKPLQNLGGKPLIVRVYENAAALKQWGARIVVAADDEAVARVCKEHNIECKLTGTQHQSGTDRCFEVSQSIASDYIMNLQGDEPFLVINDLRRLCAKTQATPSAHIATLVYENCNEKEFFNPNVVKTLASKDNFALYFSRSPIPYHRDYPFVTFLQHVGVYAFRKEALQQFCGLPISLLEQQEKLEQLRALQNEMKILLVPTVHKGFGIDTPSDLAEAESLLRKQLTNTSD